MNAPVAHPPRTVRLSDADNVVVAVDPIAVGDPVHGIQARERVPRGHKMATARIEAGAPSDIAEAGEDPLVKGVAGRPDWPLGEPDLIVEGVPGADPAADAARARLRQKAADATESFRN